MRVIYAFKSVRDFDCFSYAFVDDKKLTQILRRRGCKRLVIQAGSFVINNNLLTDIPIECEIFSYEPSIIDRIRRADLVIGHSGKSLIVDVMRNIFCGSFSSFLFISYFFYDHD